MYRILLTFILLTLSAPSPAQNKVYGDWVVVEADNGDLIAATVQDSGSKLLGYRCYKTLEKCIHVIRADITCTDGNTYPVLVNSNSSSLSLNALCVKNDNHHELILTEFKSIHLILLKANIVGFAVPMESGQFKVIRFSLNGSAKAMSKVESLISDSSEYL